MNKAFVFDSLDVEIRMSPEPALIRNVVSNTLLVSHISRWYLDPIIFFSIIDEEFLREYNTIVVEEIPEAVTTETRFLFFKDFLTSVPSVCSVTVIFDDNNFQKFFFASKEKAEKFNKDLTDFVNLA